MVRLVLRARAMQLATKTASARPHSTPCRTLLMAALCAALEITFRLGDESHLVLALDGSRALDGVLEHAEVLVVELQEGDRAPRPGSGWRRRWSWGGRGRARRRGCIAGVDLVGVAHLVDVHLARASSAVVGGRTDYGLGVDGRDEKGGLGGGEVVGKVAVWQGAAGEIVEVAALLVRSACWSGEGMRVVTGSAPRRRCPRTSCGLAFQVDDANCIRDPGPDELNYTLCVFLCGVLPLKDRLIVDGHIAGVVENAASLALGYVEQRELLALSVNLGM